MKKVKEFTIEEVVQICNCHPNCSSFISKCPFFVDRECLFDIPLYDLEASLDIEVENPLEWGK